MKLLILLIIEILWCKGYSKIQDNNDIESKKVESIYKHSQQNSSYEFTSENIFDLVNGPNTKKSAVSSVVSGMFQVNGSTDGYSTNATFNIINGIALDEISQFLYVSDYHINSGLVRKIDINNDFYVSTFAGSVGNPFQDGEGTNAGFDGVFGITVDQSGNIYVADVIAIRLITPSGLVSTIYSPTNILKLCSCLTYYKPKNLLFGCVQTIIDNEIDIITYNITNNTHAIYTTASPQFISSIPQYMSIN
jgi:hypothetical protein